MLFLEFFSQYVPLVFHVFSNCNGWFKFNRFSACWGGEQRLPRSKSGSWKVVTSYTRKRATALPQGLQLQNRFSALSTDEGLGAQSSEAPNLARPEPQGESCK